MRYDAILAPGSGLSDNWKLPGHVVGRMQYIAKLFRQGYSKKIIVSGKWSINWDFEGIVPPTTEAREMKKALVRLGISSNAIIAEEESKDTISNAYFTKVKILVPSNFRKILIVCADYQLERANFLFKKILGKDFDLTFVSTKTPKGEDPDLIKIQDEIMKKQKDFLSKMKDGDDSFLKDKFYKDSYYHEKRPTQMAKVAMKG